MKKLVLSLLAVGAMGLYSCVDDPCKDVNCDNGTCDGVTGACICETGYETDADGICSVEERAKFLGTYNLTENCSTGTDSYVVTVSTSSTGIDRIVLNNLYGAGLAVVASVDGTALTIASQSFGLATISGSGTITSSGVTLSITYSVGTASQSDACQASLVRQ